VGSSPQFLSRGCKTDWGITDIGFSAISGLGFLKGSAEVQLDSPHVATCRRMSLCVSVLNFSVGSWITNLNGFSCERAILTLVNKIQGIQCYSAAKHYPEIENAWKPKFTLISKIHLGGVAYYYSLAGVKRK
jgi:hypothetical protein